MDRKTTLAQVTISERIFHFSHLGRYLILCNILYRHIPQIIAILRYYFRYSLPGQSPINWIEMSARQPDLYVRFRLPITQLRTIARSDGISSNSRLTREPRIPSAIDHTGRERSRGPIKADEDDDRIAIRAEKDFHVHYVILGPIAGLKSGLMKVSG